MSAREKDETPESDRFPDAPHPRFAKTLIGHKMAERDALAALSEGRMPHAWLIGGPEGVGKATFAWSLARFVLANPDPAQAAKSATSLSVSHDTPPGRLIDRLAHPDLALLRRRYEEKRKVFLTQISIDDVRDKMTLFQRTSAFSGWRVCVVDCAEDLNASSANALLKVIEEPPPRSLILLVAHRIGAVLPTIRSRCRKMMLAPLSDADVGAVVATLGAPFADRPAADIAQAASAAKGSVREALRRLAAADGASAGAIIDAAMAALPRPPAALADRLADALAAKGANDDWAELEVALADWITQRARAAPSNAKREEWLSLWDRLRAILTETEAINLDKRLAVHAALAEIETVG